MFRQYEVDQEDIELFKKRHPYTALTMSNDAEIKKYLESGNNECEDIKKAD